MRFNVVYILDNGNNGQSLIRNRVNPVTARNMKELLQAIAANIQCGAEVELPIVGIHITPPENE